jgi:SAM-dependent methyltransferase
VRNLLASAVADPWGTMGLFVDGPMHPGGTELTADLLDRAGVDADTRLLDVGCGAGEALALARERGATAVGLDVEPRTDGIVRGDMARLPFAADRFDVVLAECVLCLSADYPRALAEAERVLRSGGRLAFSDVVVEGEVPDVPSAMAEALCLTGHRERAAVFESVEAAGFGVRTTRSHREALLAMRDDLAGKVDYEGLLGLLGSDGQRALDGIETLETAVEEGRVDYVSLVAEAAPRRGDGA